LIEKPPALAAILRILTAEIESAVKKQPTKLKTTAYAKTGPVDDRIAQKQIRGRSERYISAEYDPALGEVRDQDGRVVANIK
jgi:hypothetical protein